MNSLADSSATGTLRWAITDADQTAGDNTIDFAVTGTITLNAALPDLRNTTGTTDIEGPGAASLTVARSSAPGTARFSIFVVDPNVPVKLVDLTITGGTGIGFVEGGIFNSGTLAITDCTIDNNSGGAVGGGIGNVGTVTLASSTFDSNPADLGGGIYNQALGTVTVTDSTLAKNSANEGGGIGNDGTMTVMNSTIADNLSAGNVSAGGGIDNVTHLTVTNSTIADNSATGTGGGIDNRGTATITNSTIASNSDNDEGGGINNETGGTATLNNTIGALNTSGATADDISGAVSPSSAYNLIGTGGSGGLTNGINGNQVGVADPGLGPLANYGGPTQTIDLLPGSPAIDAGSNAPAVDPTTGQPLSTDQRGPGFLRIVNGTVDIGAYEYRPAAVDAVSVDWGSQSAALQTAADGLRLLPAGRETDLPWLGIDSLQITLGQAQALTAADVTISSAIGVNYGPVTVSGSGTSYTITLAQPIDAADRVTITIVNPGISLFNRRIDVLPGDVNDDGVVSVQDLFLVRNQWLGFDGATPTIFGDIDGDGVVDANDYNDVKMELGTSLPPVGADPPASGGDAVVSGAGPIVLGGDMVAADGGRASTPSLVPIRPSTTTTSQRLPTQTPRPRAELQLALQSRSRSLVSARPNHP